MADFATIPLNFITGGWLDHVSEAGFKVLIKVLALPLRKDQPIRHCCVDLKLKRGEWIMSRNQMKEAVGVKNDRTFDRALRELGPRPAGVGFLTWRSVCEHRNAKTVWTITRPDLFVRNAADIKAEKNTGTGLEGWVPPATTSTAEVATVGHHLSRNGGYHRPPPAIDARVLGAGEGKGAGAGARTHEDVSGEGSKADTLSGATELHFLITPERRRAVMEQARAAAAAHGETLDLGQEESDGPEAG